MYERFYGFSEKPFSMTPDPTFLFLGSKHAVGLSMLQYGLANEAATTVLTGDIGTGKTTLVRRILDEFDKSYIVGLISNTHESFGNLMQWVAVAFELPAETDSKAQLYEHLSNFLIERHAAGKRTVLIVDEAQNLDETMLEELRLLTNINADKAQLLQLMLVGQPELRQKLRSPRLTQFVQRIAVDFHLTSLSADETTQYIDHRLVVAGCRAGLFEPTACRFIHYQCGGIPRLINSVCDTALIYGFASGERSIDANLVYEMVRERIAAGLFGAGNVDYQSVADDEPKKALKKSIIRAKRRAAAYLRKARKDLEPKPDSTPSASETTSARS